MADMIASTQRGLLVTRFSGVRMRNSQSVLLTGLTRDGVWLIENGKITKAVKNFRFTESPLFVLNQIEQLGVPVPVSRPAELDEFEGFGVAPLSPNPEKARLRAAYYFDDFMEPRPSPALTPAVVPAIKARDFSFTALADAV